MSKVHHLAAAASDFDRAPSAQNRLPQMMIVLNAYLTQLSEFQG